MAHPEVQRALDLVREKTGYAVTVVLDPSLKLLSAMRAGSPSAPGHVILWNPKHERIANYLVALQCALLLVKWGDGEGVPDFVSSSTRTGFVEKKLASQMKDLDLPETKRPEYAKLLVDGLLRQLASVPPSILAGEWCRAECPGLKGEQEAAVTEELRQASAGLAPTVREKIPAEVFDRSAAMSAAYALWWSGVAGTEAPALPYRATGYTEKGEALLAALRALPEDAGDRYQRSIDAWAELLGMVGWFEWRLRRE